MSKLLSKYVFVVIVALPFIWVIAMSCLGNNWDMSKIKPIDKTNKTGEVRPVILPFSPYVIPIRKN